MKDCSIHRWVDTKIALEDCFEQPRQKDFIQRGILKLKLVSIDDGSFKFQMCNLVLLLLDLYFLSKNVEKIGQIFQTFIVHFEI